METYQKINTIYKRYQFDSKECPNKEWLKFKNIIIMGNFSNKEAGYLFDCMWEAYSKIDGTNSKIAFFPSTGEIKVGGKTDNASSQHGQFEMLAQIASKIQPGLVRMFPKETAKFVPVKSKETNKVQYWDTTDPLGLTTVTPMKNGQYVTQLEEVPVYIYGEYFGAGIQKGGGRYIQNGNDFVVFDIRQQGWWLPRENRNAICFELGLKTVPYLGCMTLRQIEEMVMNGFRTKYEGAADPTLLEEGIVARPVIPLCDGRGERIIVKVKLCDYLDYQRVRSQFTDEEFEKFSEWYKTVENV
jgi:hypothetical protein